jgi:acyl carrier protein
MSEKSKTYEVLGEIFRDVFMRDDIVLTPELTAADVPSWDSFKQIEIIISVQEYFGIKLSSKDIDGLHCVGDLASIIETKS